MTIVVTPKTEAILHYGRVTLEPIVPAHADALFEAMQEAQLYTFIPRDPPATKEILRERFARWSARQSPDGSETWLNYAVRESASAAYVGTVQVTIVPAAESQIAYEVFPSFWRQGLARTACEGLLLHVFANWHIDRVRAYCDTRNVASFGLLESLGFRRVDFIPNSDHFKGAPSNEYVYEFDRPSVSV
jgi:RimJ/RimL family protein N-acetyltransferase